PLGGRGLDRRDGALDIVLPHVALLVYAHEQLELGVAEGLGDLMNGLAGRVRLAGVEAVVERATDLPDVARVGGRERARPRLLVDRGLEAPPARKAVVARNRQLGVGEPRRGILDTHRLQALLGFVAEVLEAGAERKRAHDEPSFLSQGRSPCVAPGVRELRAGSQVMSRRVRCEWAEPFTRTVGPPIGPIWRIAQDAVARHSAAWMYG